MLSSLSSIQQALQHGTLSMTSLVQQYLTNIENTKSLNAFVHVFNDASLEKAKSLDHKLKNGDKLGELFGAVVSIKDNICMKGMPVSAASNILKGYTSPYNATVVQKLLDADAIIIGSTNCDEFGMGSTSTNSCYGAVKNGSDPSLIAGGSSGGAAVSVQMDCCLMALGSDTGGSVRQPASLCDVIGMKPSYGVVSRYGLIAYGSSFDQIGIISKDIDNINTCMQVISGLDAFDSTMMTAKPSTKSTGKFAIVSSMFDPSNAFTEQIKNTAFDIIGKDNIDEVAFDYMPYLIPCYYILTTAEASSNLSRYDGVRYGHRATDVSNLNDLYTKSRTEGFGPEVKKRIMLGTFVLSEGYFDAYYTKAQKLRRLITDQISTILQKYDAIIMPVTPSGAWLLDKKIEDPLEIYLSDVYTVLANITGLPALSLPVNHNGSVTNLQLMGKKGCDTELITIADDFLKRAKQRQSQS